MTTNMQSKKWRQRLTGVVIAATAMSFSTVGSAETTPRDLVVAVKAFGFVEPALSSGTIAILYDDADAASKAAAEAIAAAMPSKAKGLTLSGVATPISNAGAISSAGAVFLVDGLSADAQAAASSASVGKLCFTTTRAYVEAGHCVMAVASKPKVEIVVSAGAATKSGIGFAGAFRMMIKEI